MAFVKAASSPPRQRYTTPLLPKRVEGIRQMKNKIVFHDLEREYDIIAITAALCVDDIDS